MKTTNPDGTTRIASYGGCGCAGGEVVTLTDEGTLASGTTKRRQQKIYADVFGRTVKTEILNWEGGTVYSSKVNTYNALDQLTRMRQFAGPEGSATYQDTLITYDGHGRLKTRHLPEHAAGAATIWDYNDDDTIQKITDARGATTAYSYNARHQVIGVTNALSGLSTIETTLEYDAVGNRLEMLHKIDDVLKDRTNYSYDQLSRLASETKFIAALTNSPTGGNYTMGYSYTPSGQLKSVTDPFSSTTNFDYDATGRTQSVSGSYGGQNYTYANNLSYRAWGAVKGASFGDNRVSTVNYNKRLLPTEYRLTAAVTNGMRYDYSYFDDGRLERLTDLDDVGGQPSQVTFHYMSRAYDYDQVGRVSGVGAVPNNWALPAPFSGSYSYDAFDNLTNRTGVYGLNTQQSDSASYVNDRRSQTGWSYDDDGRVTASADTATATSRTWTYDAAGNQTSVVETGGGTTTTNTLQYDGDGRVLFESVSSSPGSTSSDYLIRSSVLRTGLTKLDAAGNKLITYVPTNGLVMPLQSKDSSGNPTMSYVHRDASGLQEDGKAKDPFGALINNVQPPTSGGPPNMPFYAATYGGVSLSQFSNPTNLSAGCYSAQNNNPGICNGVLQEQMAHMPPLFWANQPHAPADPYAIDRYESHMNNAIYRAKNGQGGNAPERYEEDLNNSDVTILIGLGFLETSSVMSSGIPQNPTPNPNCLQNAVVGSPGVGRSFDAAPGPDGKVFHDGPHALSPANAANAVTLPALAGEVIYKNVQEYTTDSRGRRVPALYTVDVRPTNGNFIVVYKDLASIGVYNGQMLAAGDVIGTVRPAGDPKNFIGLHVALVRPEFYGAFRRETKTQAQQNRLSTVNTRKMFIDPIGPGGLLRCP